MRRRTPTAASESVSEFAGAASGTLCATATTLVQGVHLLSFHTDVDGHYNNTNPGVYASYDRHTVGAYRNPDRRQTVCAGREFELDEACRFDLTAGLATIYDNRPVIPAALVGVKFAASAFADGATFRLQLSPTTRSNDAGGHLHGLLAHSAFKLRF